MVVPKRWRRTAAAHVRQRLGHAIAHAMAVAVMGVLLWRREGRVVVKAGPLANALRRPRRHYRRVKR